MASVVPTKRQRASVNIGEFAETIREDPVNAILELMQLLNVNVTALSPVKEKPPSFSRATWPYVVKKFGLPYDLVVSALPRVDYLHCHLPPSFHRRILIDSIRWLDVYQDRGAQDKEAARVRLMDGWHVPICALFRGRLVDKPEHHLPETQYSSGGQVEHEVYVFEGTILLIVEMKISISASEQDNVAQVMLELATAYTVNAKKGFVDKPSVFAVLTDLMMFKFFSYDGSNFSRNGMVVAYGENRLEFITSMIPVTEALFSILLHGYILNLRAVIAKSKDRASQGDDSGISSASVAEPFKSGSPLGPRRSLGQWEKALAAAEQSQLKLIHCNRASRDAAEEDGVKGVSLLEESVNYLPKIGHVQEDWKDQEFRQEIEKMLDDMYSAS